MDHIITNEPVPIGVLFDRCKKEIRKAGGSVNVTKAVMKKLGLTKEAGENGRILVEPIRRGQAVVTGEEEKDDDSHSSEGEE